MHIDDVRENFQRCLACEVVHQRKHFATIYILSGGACTFMHVAPDMKCINVQLLRYLNHFIAISNGIISFDPLPSLLYYIFYCSQVYHDIVCSCFDQDAGISVCVHLYRHCISFAQETWPDMSLPACVPHICINASKHLVHIIS